jgi:hypothetical protein
MIRSSLPQTTHTLEMAQVAELNARLADHRGASAITAEAIGMGGARLHPSGAAGLAGDAVLVRVSWQGSPEFPDVYGHFGPGRGSSEALLHTAALNQLAHFLGVRQCWGIGRPAGPTGGGAGRRT